MNKINPESEVLAQMDGHWQKLALSILWKLAGKEKVVVSASDMEAMLAEFAPFGPVIYVHGHSDSMSFQIVTVEAANDLAKFDAMMRAKTQGSMQ